MGNKKLLNILVLYTIHEYIVSTIKEEIEVTDFIYRLKGSLALFVKNNKTTIEGGKRLLELGQDETMKRIVSKEISHIVFALQLLSLWVDDIPKKERPLLGISDKNLKKEVYGFVVPMLKLKQSNIDKYDELHEIIKSSKLTAKEFYFYAKEQLC